MGVSVAQQGLLKWKKAHGEHLTFELPQTPAERVVESVCDIADGLSSVHVLHSWTHRYHDIMEGPHHFHSRFTN